ncbi:hypothetical protein BDN70DRAFT_901555 [Pholiota conissans]|uniref:Uncharacterized protein n=1 Tax=Pholiota conissans TaxID=109636 RepID=A0A9P5YNR0_9AGAR|nr:hypothetical protein BDN70DRAFT_901555 [Pholiota conissans]
MPPRNRSGFNEYIPSQSEAPSSVVRTRHTSYQHNASGVRTLLDVPMVATAAVTSEESLDRGNEPSAMESLGVDGDVDDISASLEENAREMEAVGLGAEVEGSQRKRQRGPGDLPLLLWVPFIDTYVNEFLRLDGRGDAIHQIHCATENCDADIASPKQGFRSYSFALPPSRDFAALEWGPLRTSKSQVIGSSYAASAVNIMYQTMHLCTFE